MADWPQAAANAARTAFQSGVSLGTSWSVAWRYQYQVQQREKIHGSVQPIISNGHVLLPSLMGKLRSFVEGVSGGGLEWTADVGAPILSTPCADGTNVYVADIWGRLSAFKLADGTRATGWPAAVQVTQYGLPFQCDLLLADSKLLIGGADGNFYARSLSDGSALWSYAVGAPILHSAAWSNATGTNTVVFGANDMKVRALNSGSGAVLGTSAVLAGGAFNAFYPVIVGTKVIVQPIAALPFWIASMPSSIQNPIRGIPADIRAAGTPQDDALAAYVASPSSYVKSTFVLSLADMSETANQQIIHWEMGVNNNGPTPAPCLEQRGYLVFSILQPTGRSPSATLDYGGWACLDLSTRKFVDDLYDATPRGYNNRDENVAVSGCANGIIAAHNQETNAQITGFYRRSDQLWYPFGPGAATTELFVNTGAPHATPMAIVGGTNGMCYHNCHPHTLVAWRSS